MKRVMEQYGGAMIAAIIAIVIMGLFCHVSYRGTEGMPQILGEMVQVILSEEDGKGSEENAFDTYMNVKLPDITIVNHYAGVAKEWVPVSEYVTAVDEDGNAVPITILYGWSAGVTDGAIEVSGDGTKIYATESGVYWVQASVCAGNGRCRNVIVKLMVNEEELA